MSLADSYIQADELFIEANKKCANRGAALTEAEWKRIDLSPLLWISVAAMSIGAAAGSIVYDHWTLVRVHAAQAEISALLGHEHVQ